LSGSPRMLGFPRLPCLLPFEYSSFPSIIITDPAQRCASVCSGVRTVLCFFFSYQRIPPFCFFTQYQVFHEAPSPPVFLRTIRVMIWSDLAASSPPPAPFCSLPVRNRPNPSWFFLGAPALFFSLVGAEF